jgi:hypothetical protein
MRLTHRHRHRRDAFAPISISEAEITADLIYPAQPQRRPAPETARAIAHGKRR